MARDNLMRVRLLFPAFLALGLLAAGCSSKTKLVKVEGVVKLDGKPLPRAEVKFMRQDGNTSPAHSVTGADGDFRLTTFSTGDGAYPGEYKVLVTLAEESKGDSAPGDPSDPKEMMEAMKRFSEKGMKKGNEPKSRLHPNYGDVAKTPLRQIIPPPEGKVVLELRKSGS